MVASDGVAAAAAAVLVVAVGGGGGVAGGVVAVAGDAAAPMAETRASYRRADSWWPARVAAAAGAPGAGAPLALGPRQSSYLPG